ncbi:MULTISPECIES: hypothetical protein [Comamonas]|uniref:hypothetical protein n=1 Tax=Comamonas TaxID=283 RepID=UPI0001DA67ED|nr:MULTISPECIES: hypothetical protein [Comamonas]EFI60727.1 hypothetical protein CTS44_14923 [Comamonas thiooxydans]TFF63094.1 hypothetical protein EIC84_03350 [Comamonas sp. A23]
MKLKEMMQWLLKLLPQQKMQENGNGSLQAGRVEGDLHHSHTQAVYNIFMMAPEPAKAPAPAPIRTNEKLPADGWQEVFRMIRNLPQSKGESVFRFMERKFHTRMVRELRPDQLQEVRLYAAKIARNMAASSRRPAP